MIKWFDVDKFLPGNGCDMVLIRFIINNVDNNHKYCIGTYKKGEWNEPHNLDGIESHGIKVTHWAFIEEPI